MSTDTKEARKAAVVAALSVAEAIGQGTMALDALEETTVAELRELFATVYGPEDPVWPTQLDVARQVLAFGGLGADELAEWVAVQRRREGRPVVEPEVSWIERALADGADDEDDWPADDAVSVDAVREAMATVERRLGVVRDEDTSDLDV